MSLFGRIQTPEFFRFAIQQKSHPAPPEFAGIHVMKAFDIQGIVSQIFTYCRKEDFSKYSASYLAKITLNRVKYLLTY